VMTKLVPRLRQTFAKAGSAGCLCLKPQRKNPRPAAILRVCLVLR